MYILTFTKGHERFPEAQNAIVVNPHADVCYRSGCMVEGVYMVAMRLPFFHECGRGTLFHFL